MPINTGSYVLSSEDTPSPFNQGQAQTANTTPHPSYHQQQQQQSERMQPQYTSTQPPYNQPPGQMSQFAQGQQQQGNEHTYPPSYESSPTPYPYPNMQGGGGSVSHQQQPMPHPSPVAQQEGKPMFSPETKEKGKFLCQECGSGAKWACGATLMIFGCLCGFCGALFS